MRDESPDDVPVAAGLAGNAVAVELVGMLWAKGLLTDGQVTQVLRTAIMRLEEAAKRWPHPLWEVARDLVLIEARRYEQRPGWNEH